MRSLVPNVALIFFQPQNLMWFKFVGSILCSDDTLVFLSHQIQHYTKVFLCYTYIFIVDLALGQDGWILAKFSFCLFMDRDEVDKD